MSRTKTAAVENAHPPVRTIAEHIADRLRGEIVSAELAPGTPIRQSHLATRYGVSQAPVREALGQLASEELVEYHTNRGVRVAELRKSHAQEIASLRILIETDLVMRAAGHFTRSDEDAAMAAITATASAATIVDKLAADDAFHLAIYNPAGHPITLDVVQRLRARYVQYLGYMWKHTDHAPASLDDHRKLLQLMKAGKGEQAAAFLRRHIDASTQAIVSCLNES
ncbi:MAG: GntR family transcriptional regulator [Rhodospirillales bacterium]